MTAPAPRLSTFVRHARRLMPTVCWGLSLFVWAAQAGAQALPPDIEAALQRARLPKEAVTFLVTDAEGRQPPRLAHRANAPMNPASLTKLVTTFAALDLLGPAFSWSTPVYADGAVRDGTLTGHLYLKGQGDPKLVLERLWLLLRRVQALGIKRIDGDIVLDHSAFEAATVPPGDFDGETQRPYNVAADALLINYHAVVMTFTPDPAQGVARVQYEPPLAGVQTQDTVPLESGPCTDWRATLKAQLGDPARLGFAGRYPGSCGERSWSVAYAEPGRYGSRAVAGLWREMGGQLSGQVRDAQVPAGLKPLFSASSPPLADVIRDINKFSNNVMAQQLFLTLSLQQKGLGSVDGSRDVLRQWWLRRFGESDLPVIDNGSGLSRDTRMSAQALGRLLQAAWAAGTMPELLASLPVSGVDGTLRRTARGTPGTAHLKTGSLRDVQGVAGIVHGASGRRHVLVALANHPNAAALRPVIESLIDWTTRDLPSPP